MDSLPYSQSRLRRLPPEILGLIIDLLPASDLARLACTCKHLKKETEDDRVWLSLLRRHLPNFRPTDSKGGGGLKSLYASFFPFWFLPQHRLWFCDGTASGKLILVRYDHRAQSIEGCQFFATNLGGEEDDDEDETLETWSDDPTLRLDPFRPVVMIRRSNPIFKLERNSQTHIWPDWIPRGTESRSRVNSDRLVTIGSPYSGFFGSLSLLKFSPPSNTDFSYLHWPGEEFPAQHRVQSAGSEPSELTVPRNLAEASDQLFKLKRWISTGLSTTNPTGRKSETDYATIDPLIYTPTPAKPWRGIWVGDYSAHGLEFILVHQPDEEPPMENISRPWTGTSMKPGERPLDPYAGRIEAIKLTGDPNVPRGEITWRSPDIGPKGLIRIADGRDFHSAHLVRGEGHIAHHGFVNDSWTQVELILCPPNPDTGLADTLAVHWLPPYQHISQLRRMNLEIWTNIKNNDEISDPLSDVGFLGDTVSSEESL